MTEIEKHNDGGVGPQDTAEDVHEFEQTTSAPSSIEDDEVDFSQLLQPPPAVPDEFPEDLTASTLLSGLPSLKGTRAKALRDDLRIEKRSHVPETLASYRFMRIMRIRLVGAMLEVVADLNIDEVRAFTLVPASWEFSASDLSDVDPRRLMAALRAQLYRRGAGRRSH